MCEALRELMRPEIDEEIEKEKDKTTLKNIQNIMEGLKYTAEQAMELLKIPAADQSKYLAKL